MAINIGDVVPNFTADTTEGEINFHAWIGDHYAILFSHPKDFTPVCTTEFMTFATMMPEFEKLNTQLVGLSIESDWPLRR